jgi:hypothetical protein
LIGAAPAALYVVAAAETVACAELVPGWAGVIINNDDANRHEDRRP